MIEAPGHRDICDARVVAGALQRLADAHEAAVAPVAHWRDAVAVPEVLQQSAAGHAAYADEIAERERPVEMGLDVVERELHAARPSGLLQAIEPFAEAVRL